VIVLACTHFPLLRDFLLDLLPKSIQLIDSGQAIAARVKHLLLHHGWTLPESNMHTIKPFFLRNKPII
jgi:glutamate racemase